VTSEVYIRILSVIKALRL